MSADQNRQTVQQLYEAFGRGDFAALLDGMTEDIVWRCYAATPFAGVYRGKAGVQEFFAKQQLIDLERFDVKQILAEGDTVVVLIDNRYTVKATGKSAEGPIVQVLTVKDGKVAEWYEVEHAAVEAWS
ncbi:MAG TPA: nuclear transport factor 2 family protein [Actinomycetota bacterium]|nr:nuclear transport factor 2 family protein [Actinomycetota bacterium]